MNDYVYFITVVSVLVFLLGLHERCCNENPGAVSVQWGLKLNLNFSATLLQYCSFQHVQNQFSLFQTMVTSIQLSIPSTLTSEGLNQTGVQE